MSKFETTKPLEGEGSDNIIDFQAAKERLETTKESPEAVKEELAAELKKGCDRLETRFSVFQQQALPLLSSETVAKLRKENEEVYQAIKAYRDGALDMISQAVSVEELRELRKMNAEFCGELERYADQGQERLRRRG